MLRLPHDPITEAVINLRTRLPPDVGLPRLDAFHDAVRDRYPEKEPLYTVPGQMLMTGEPMLVPNSERHDGYRERS